MAKRDLSLLEQAKRDDRLSLFLIIGYIVFAIAFIGYVLLFVPNSCTC